MILGFSARASPRGLHLLNESNNTLSGRAVSRVILVQKCASSNAWHTARVNKQYLQLQKTVNHLGA